VVVVGDAVTLAPVLDDSVADGDHAYRLAPVAVNVTELPTHIVVSGPADDVKPAPTVTAICIVSLQPALFVPTNV